MPDSPDDARVLAALEVLGWPDDREASAHVESDGFEVTPARHYWDLVSDTLRAADAAGPGSLLPTGAYISVMIHEGDNARSFRCLFGTTNRFSQFRPPVEITVNP